MNSYITVTLTRAQADALGYAIGAARREIGTPASHFDRTALEGLKTAEVALDQAPYHEDYLKAAEEVVHAQSSHAGPAEQAEKNFLTSAPIAEALVERFLSISCGDPRDKVGLIAALRTRFSAPGRHA